MNLEGITLSALTKYLQEEISGSKIYKVFMPTPHSLLLQLKRRQDTCSVLIDMSGFGPVIYLPDKLPENPDVPPAFCMLLRKHLEEGRITKITQTGTDRIITFEIDILGSSSKIITKKLIFELTGKNNNIILVQDSNIIDSLKHINAAQNSYRTIQPGKEYIAPPPQNGLDILTASPEEIINKVTQLPSANILQALITATVGIGKATAEEILLAADILPGQIALQPKQKADLEKVLAKLQNKNQQNSTVYAVIGKTNQLKNILLLPPHHINESVSVKEFADINAAINFAAALKPLQLPQHEQLHKIVTSEISKQTKKLHLLENDLQTANDAETQKILADTLMANIYQLQKGADSAELYNIYDGNLLTIPLSPQLTPVENAQAYYKRYNKYKRAQTEICTQINATKELLQYLETLEISLVTANSKSEIEEILQELTAVGLVKENKKKTKFTSAKSQPLHIRLNENTDVYIGKNNRQNDYVTFSVGQPKDYWLHTKDIPGSHVILKTTLPEPDEKDLLTAVQLAAYFSKGRNSSKVPVDCTLRKYVKKPSGSKPGFVIFTNQKTYYTTPETAAIEKLLLQ